MTHKSKIIAVQIKQLYIEQEGIRLLNELEEGIIKWQLWKTTKEEVLVAGLIANAECQLVGQVSTLKPARNTCIKKNK